MNPDTLTYGNQGIINNEGKQVWYMSLESLQRFTKKMTLDSYNLIMKDKVIITSYEGRMYLNKKFK